MPRIQKIKPARDSNGKKLWRVDNPASISPQGKRLRFCFETETGVENGARLAKMPRLALSAIDLYQNFIRLPSGITKTRQTRNLGIPTLAPYSREVEKVVPYPRAPFLLHKKTRPAEP